MTRVELKSAAKEQIKGNIWTLFLMMLIVVALAFVCNLIPYVGGIISFIITPAFSISLCMAYLKLTKQEKVEVGDVFEGFKITGKALWLQVLTSFFTFLWSLLFVIPGIIKMYAYSMAPYILAENPEMSASEALEKSKQITQGHKFDLFVLHLSFILWAILSVITCGIASIYVIPYKNVTIANFYNSIKE